MNSHAMTAKGLRLEAASLRGFQSIWGLKYKDLQAAWALPAGRLPSLCTGGDSGTAIITILARVCVGFSASWPILPLISSRKDPRDGWPVGEATGRPSQSQSVKPRGRKTGRCCAQAGAPVFSPVRGKFSTAPGTPAQSCPTWSPPPTSNPEPRTQTALPVSSHLLPAAPWRPPGSREMEQQPQGPQSWQLCPPSAVLVVPAFGSELKAPQKSPGHFQTWGN